MSLCDGAAGTPASPDSPDNNTSTGSSTVDPYTGVDESTEAEADPLGPAIGRLLGVVPVRFAVTALRSKPSPLGLIPGASFVVVACNRCGEILRGPSNTRWLSTDEILAHARTHEPGL